MGSGEGTQIAKLGSMHLPSHLTSPLWALRYTALQHRSHLLTAGENMVGSRAHTHTLPSSTTNSSQSREGKYRTEGKAQRTVGRTEEQSWPPLPGRELPLQPRTCTECCWHRVTSSRSKRCNCSNTSVTLPFSAGCRLKRVRAGRGETP